IHLLSLLCLVICFILSLFVISSTCFFLFFFFSSRRRHTRSVSAFLLNRSSDLLFLILKSGVNHTSRGSISTSTLPSIKLRKCSSKIITSILSFISGRLATKSNQIKQLIRNGRSASLQR